MSESNNTNQNQVSRDLSMSTWRTCRKVSDLIQGREKAQDRYGREAASLFLLYLAAKMKNKNGGTLGDISNPEDFLGECKDHGLLKDESPVGTFEELKSAVNGLLSKEEWTKIKKEFNANAQNNDISSQGVAREILRHSFYISSSLSLNILVKKILLKEELPADSDITILDIGSGDGTFMTALSGPFRDPGDAAQSASEDSCRRLHYTGLDKNGTIQMVARIRAEVAVQELSERGAPTLGSIDFKTKDCRELEEKDQIQYDRIFVDLGRDGRRPWDDDVTPVRRRTTEENAPSYPKLKNLNDPIDLSDFDAKKLYESEWYAALVALNLLSEKEGSKAVMTMSISALCGAAAIDKTFRQKFVNWGWVQQVILLPRPMQRFSRGRECLVVFSRGNKNATVRMIDARNFYEEMGWRTKPAPNFIEKIVDADPEEEFCRDVADGEIKESDCSLYPVKYLMRVEGERLDKLAVITRGKDIPRSKLRKPEEPHQSEEDSEQERVGLEKTYYLSISDIDSGFLEITEETIPIVGDDNDLGEMGIDPQNDYLRAGDLLLGKMLDGDRFGLRPQARVAVIEEKDLKDKMGNVRKLVAGSNLFVFREPPLSFYDKTGDRHFPYFLKAFLESDACREQLELAAAGSALSSISINSLKEIKVSEAMYEGAEELDKDYAEKYQELRKLREGLKTLTETTKTMFDNPEILRRTDTTDGEK
ncbi:MAG: N-6 DNA methylase [Thermoguttaceae bacterium]|nr:N-6 DNA methylase [Thermoguttaceae bacterium]